MDHTKYNSGVLANEPAQCLCEKCGQTLKKGGCGKVITNQVDFVPATRELLYTHAICLARHHHHCHPDDLGPGLACHVWDVQGWTVNK